MRAAHRKYSKHDNKEKWSKTSEGVGGYLFYFFKRKKNGMKFRISRSIEKSRRRLLFLLLLWMTSIFFLKRLFCCGFFYIATIERSLFFFVFRFGSHCWDVVSSNRARRRKEKPFSVCPVLSHSTGTDSPKKIRPRGSTTSELGKEFQRDFRINWLCYIHTRTFFGNDKICHF